MDYLESGFTLHRFAVLDSTNETAKEILFSNNRELLNFSSSKGFAVLAGQQKAGKGRRGNKWISPPGNLYLSIVFPLPVPVIRASEVGFLAANIVWDSLVSFEIKKAGLVLKWPNDILYEGKKLAGILPECELMKHKYDNSELHGKDHNLYWLIVGIGLNITSSPLDNMTRYGATSLKDQGLIIQPDHLADRILSLFSAGIEAWVEQGFDPIKTVYENRMIGKGCAVSVQLPDVICQGRVIGLDIDGALLMFEEQSGLTKRITAGEIFFND